MKKMRSKEEVQSYAKMYAGECISALMSKREIKRPNRFARVFVVRTKEINRSWGGITYSNPKRPYISIGLLGVDHYMRLGAYTEYASFNKHHEMGGFKTTEMSEQVALAAIVGAITAHEVAHAVGYWNKDSHLHDSMWKYRYRLMRRALGLVNLPSLNN